MNATRRNIFQSLKPQFEVGRAYRSLKTGLLGLSLAGLLAFSGCGAQQASMEEPASMSTGAAPGSPPMDSAANESAKSADSRSAGGGAAPPAGGVSQLVKSASAVPRKIIYNATVELVTNNFPTAERNLLALIKANGGYIAETNISGTPGSPRNGTWKIRVPETGFESFMNAVVKLGELQTTHTDSQDVTAEFYDLQARISNKQVEEKRLITLLKTATGKLKEILEVEKEISRVRGEIEQMQGQLRLLANLSSLTTITVTLREVKNYAAPKPVTFGEKIARTFESSLGQLRDFGQGIILMFVALTPWLLILAVFVLPVWLITRRKKP